VTDPVTAPPLNLSPSTPSRSRQAVAPGDESPCRRGVPEIPTTAAIKAASSAGAVTGRHTSPRTKETVAPRSPRAEKFPPSRLPRGNLVPGSSPTRRFPELRSSRLGVPRFLDPESADFGRSWSGLRRGCGRRGWIRSDSGEKLGSWSRALLGQLDFSATRGSLSVSGTVRLLGLLRFIHLLRCSSSPW
jgi:hypothetical protein